MHVQRCVSEGFFHGSWKSPARIAIKTHASVTQDSNIRRKIYRVRKNKCTPVVGMDGAPGLTRGRIGFYQVHGIAPNRAPAILYGTHSPFG